jgi:hypothetical protein
LAFYFIFKPSASSSPTLAVPCAELALRPFAASGPATFAARSRPRRLCYFSGLLLDFTNYVASGPLLFNTSNGSVASSDLQALKNILTFSVSEIAQFAFAPIQTSIHPF